MKLWTGRFHKELDKTTNDFNSSISFDSRMAHEDIKGSIAHATMLGACGVIDKAESEKICAGLEAILADLESGALSIDPNAEDIHTFIEGELTARLGDSGKRLHTARSRNDQVALDDRLYLRNQCETLRGQLTDLVRVLCKKAEAHADDVMPGYTHLQRAQPITFGHHLMAYAEMFLRDLSRLEDAQRRMNVCPLGSGALAGTTYPLDRELTASLLGFDGPTHNSLDGVSDRDFCMELAAAIAICMVHLSRFSEEIILWCSWEFKFIELDDAFSTGSSIMPQKKNPDIPELVRGKTGRVYGHLMGILTTIKGIPLAYNKDLQEDKEPFFDAQTTLESCLSIYTALLSKLTFNVNRMYDAAGEGYSTATDVADYLAKRGVPFRDAHAVTGKLVRYCIETGKALPALTLEEFRAASPVFEEDVLHAVTTRASAEGRDSVGGSSVRAAKAGIASVKKRLKQY